MWFITFYPAKMKNCYCTEKPHKGQFAHSHFVISLEEKKMMYNIHTSYLNWSVSVESSCSIMSRTCTNSVITIGQSDVVPLEDTLNKRTRKHKKTWATNPGTTCPNRVTSVRRSREKNSRFINAKSYLKIYCKRGNIMFAYMLLLTISRHQNVELEKNLTLL